MEMQYQKILPPQGRSVEEEAKRERNRSDVTRARVEERRKEVKSPPNPSSTILTRLEIPSFLAYLYTVGVPGLIRRPWRDIEVVTCVV
ncbi:hypothetical protein TNCV_755241 [Trichonephila clavipes]|nr:hypothetical protein TNCV_755241 [Trichonephila clavipes]